MPVVKFPVVFLASSTASKSAPPMPAKVVILRARQALTLGKTIRPIMSKYNVDPDQAVVCISGTCEAVKLSTPVSSIYQKSLTVLSEQQFAERKSIPKREYQKELLLVPAWMTSSNPEGLPFHQHGDVGFCEVSIEAEGKGLKQYATRSYSSNPREFFKFGRKPSQAKASRLGENREAESVAVGSPNESTGFAAHLRHPNFGRGSDRRKSLGSSASPSAGASSSQQGNMNASSHLMHPGTTSHASALAVGLVAPQDIPYCGENDADTSEASSYPLSSSTLKHEALYPTKSAVSTSASSFGSAASYATARQSMCYNVDIPDFLKKNENIPSSTAQMSTANNGSMPCVPAIYASAVRSDKDTAMTPTEVIESGLAWQKADYV